MQAAKSKTWLLSEDRQELRPKHVAAIFNKNFVQQFGIKYYIRNIVSPKLQILNSIKVVLCDSCNICTCGFLTATEYLVLKSI
jgi:hypothetical protein